MEAITDLTITVSVDTSAARQEVAEFRRYALQAIEEIRAAYASLGPQTGGLDGGDVVQRR